MSSLSTQVGGDHYKSLAIQPVEYITKNGLGYIEGSVIKYVTRHKSKHGAEDIKKAIHFLNLLLELEYGKKESSGLPAKVDYPRNSECKAKVGYGLFNTPSGKAYKNFNHDGIEEMGGLQYWKNRSEGTACKNCVEVADIAIHVLRTCS